MSTEVQPEGLAERQISPTSSPEISLSPASLLEIQTQFVSETNGISVRRVFVDHTPMGAYQRNLSPPVILDEDQGPMGAD